MDRFVEHVREATAVYQAVVSDPPLGMTSAQALRALTRVPSHRLTSGRLSPEERDRLLLTVHRREGQKSPEGFVERQGEEGGANFRALTAMSSGSVVVEAGLVRVLTDDRVVAEALLSDDVSRVAASIGHELNVVLGEREPDSEVVGLLQADLDLIGVLHPLGDWGALRADQVERFVSVVRRLRTVHGVSGPELAELLAADPWQLTPANRLSPQVLWAWNAQGLVSWPVPEEPVTRAPQAAGADVLDGGAVSMSGSAVARSVVPV
ncbi:hypothetical protein, partial [Streptomyces sp. NPDC002547]